MKNLILILFGSILLISCSSNSSSNSNDCPIPSEGQTIQIGNQIWSQANLNLTQYRNGDIIPQSTNLNEWVSLTTGAWCYYDNDPANELKYGKLYNWYAVNDIRGLAPQGFHIASDSEWTILTNYLGGETVAGGGMKELGNCHWASPNASATNTSGFTALPGGYRDDTGSFYFKSNNGLWWSSTSASSSYPIAWTRDLSFGMVEVGRSYHTKLFGLSVRCIKD